MKRNLFRCIFFPAILCLIFTCCGRTDSEKNRMAIFRDSLSIEARNGDIRFNLTTEADNENAVFSFSEPEALSELTIRVQNGDVFALYSGMETKVTEQFPAAVLPLRRAVIAFRTINGTDTTSAEAERTVYEAFWESDGTLSRIEVKQPDGTRIVYEILSVKRKSENE